MALDLHVHGLTALPDPVLLQQRIAQIESDFYSCGSKETFSFLSSRNEPVSRFDYKANYSLNKGTSCLALELMFFNHDDDGVVALVTAMRGNEVGITYSAVLALSLADENQEIEDEWECWVQPAGSYTRRDFYFKMKSVGNFAADSIDEWSKHFVASLPLAKS